MDKNIYIKSLNSEITTREYYNICTVPIYMYTIKEENGEYKYSINYDEKPVKCVQEEECNLDTKNPANNYGCASGYYLKRKIINNDMEPILINHDNEEGILYKCVDIVGNDKVRRCIEVREDEFKRGYYKNVDRSVGYENVPYIKCSTLNSCVGVSVTKENCSDVKIGDIIAKGDLFVIGNEVVVDSRKYEICIDKDKGIELSEGEHDKAFISINPESTSSSRRRSVVSEGADAFGMQVQDSFVLLDIGENVFRYDDDKFKYRYSNTDKIMIKKNDEINKDEYCSPTILGMKLYEFTKKLDENGGVIYEQTF